MGEHNCLYYHSLEDLYSVAANFLEDGIKKHMLCLWIIPEEFGVEVAQAALKETLKDVDQYVKTGQLEIREFHDWYVPSGKFDPAEALKAFTQKESQALERGFSAFRTIGDSSGFLTKDREKLIAYESSVAKAIAQSKTSALCTYATEQFSREEMKTLSKYHDITLSKLHGTLSLFR
ncbi:MAG: MEDS domain-containing protein [Candidatus Omnitrophota bacterium]